MLDLTAKGSQPFQIEGERFIHLETSRWSLCASTHIHKDDNTYGPGFCFFRFTDAPSPLLARIWRRLHVAASVW